MKKTGRRNKTHQQIKYPTTVFTVDDLNGLNSDYCNITLRVHLNNAIERGEVITIGHLQNGKGRPKLVMAHSPVTNEHLESAKNQGVFLINDLTVNVDRVSDDTNGILFKKEISKKTTPTNIISRDEIIRRVNAILA